MLALVFEQASRPTVMPDIGGDVKQAGTAILFVFAQQDLTS